jgi:hypothetical protein
MILSLFVLPTIAVWPWRNLSNVSYNMKPIILLLVIPTYDLKQINPNHFMP